MSLRNLFIVLSSFSIESHLFTAIIDAFPLSCAIPAIFVSWSVIPEDYKIIKAGVIVTTDKTVGESGDGFNADTALRVATGTTDAGQLRYTYSVKSSKVVYVRAYLVCSDANGVLHTVYGETVSASLAE